jgi:Fe-S cluster assembly protein SufD
VTSTATLPTLRQPLDPQWVERFSVERGEPDWLQRARCEAAQREAAWPTGQEEEWRRFPPREIPDVPLTGATSSFSATIGLPAGVIAADLAKAVRERPDVVRPWLERTGRVPTHPAFRRISEALWSTGAFVHVPRGVHVDIPIVLDRTWDAANAACLSRTIVVAEPESSVTVVEDVTSVAGADRRVAIPHLDVHLQDGAEVTYIQIQRFAADVWDLGGQWYGSGPSSRLASYNVLLGTTRTKLGILSDILGDGAEVKLYGVIAAADSQKIDVDSLQLLDGRASQSDLLYLSALYESAKATYYGLVRVQPTSHATGSYQECRNLLLSDKAGAHPIPVLEILTNDVARCGHGATAGRIDEEELFYVMSRGIERKLGEQLLVRGHFSRVVDRIPSAQIRARVLGALVPRIGSVAEIEEKAAA